MSGTKQAPAEGPRRFPLVLTPEDRAALVQLAERENRTITGQIRHLIKQATSEEETAA
jgi:hypothetical protein